ncbi:bystin [Typha angustifolia]|uniref:bystin n=1 Tax=Typha angustifolia TaxID=59011 RepID=UPI003C2B4FAA
MAGKKRKGTQPPPQKKQNSSRAALDADDSVVSKKRSRLPKQHQFEEEKISSDLSSKILREAIKQQKEIEQETEDGNLTSFSAVSDAPSVHSESDEEEEDFDGFDGFSETQSQYDGGELEIDEEDERVLAAFMPKDAGPQQTLADLIIQRIKEKDAAVTSEARPVPKMDSTVIDLYKGVGKLLRRYTNGKIPKAFKHIPAIELWEDVLYLTEPENWSPSAMYQATRIFSSNMNAKRAQRFYNLVLLPRVREDIRKNKRLHFALYQSLKKSLYKPAAFFKGVLLPLCQSGTCTLREAVIIGSIIEKVTIPPLHSSAALMKLADMDYCGTTSYFIKLFLDKKYALPYRVLDAVLAHFMRFREDRRVMPVIWHQSLLAFVQRYKNELEKKDKDALDNLMQYQKHYLVTPEIRRELKNSRNRGEKDDDLMLIASPISVINKPIEEDRWDFPEVPMEED